MNNKLVNMILFFLEGGEKLRSDVTYKIKNYPKDLRDDAIQYVVKEKLVRLTERRPVGFVGRTPVYVSLTEKGSERALEVSRTPTHNSVWNV